MARNCSCRFGLLRFHLTFQGPPTTNNNNNNATTSESNSNSKQRQGAPLGGTRLLCFALLWCPSLPLLGERFVPNRQRQRGVSRRGLAPTKQNKGSGQRFFTKHPLTAAESGRFDCQKSRGLAKSTGGSVGEEFGVVHVAVSTRRDWPNGRTVCYCDMQHASLRRHLESSLS